MKRSLHADEPANDWFSDALTPVSMKPKPTLVGEILPPVEDEEAEVKAIEYGRTMAIHMTIQERFMKETT